MTLVEVEDRLGGHFTEPSRMPKWCCGVGAFGDAVACAEQPLPLPAVINTGKCFGGRGFHSANVGVADSLRRNDLEDLDEFDGNGDLRGAVLGVYRQRFGGQHMANNVRYFSRLVGHESANHHAVADAGGANFPHGDHQERRRGQRGRGQPQASRCGLVRSSCWL